MIGTLHLMSLMQEVRPLPLHRLISPTPLAPPQAFEGDPSIIDAAVADIIAVKDRDPACEQYSQCVLYFKGYQVIQCHRWVGASPPLSACSIGGRPF